MAYRNKTYVCFDADNDIDYYKKMLKWKADDDIDFDFYDAHDLNNLRDDTQEETIKRKLRERFTDTKLLIVLVGDVTKNLYKYVRWEIEVALKLEIPIIAVNIMSNTTRILDNYPPIIRDDQLILNVQYNQILLQYSIDNWIDVHSNQLKKGNIYQQVWKRRIYEKLGLAY